MSEPGNFLFHTPSTSSIFTGTTGTVDDTNCVIRGVSLITGNCMAEGHDLKVDGETVTKLHSLANERGMVPVNLDHGSGIEKTCGYVDNFRMDGEKLRGDWHLLKAHKETPLMLERAKRMPDCFGLSVAFKGKGVAVAGGGKAARAEKLLSVDCVTRPAANEGLFSVKDKLPVDSFKNGMDPNQNQQPSLADVMSHLQSIGGRLDAFEQSHNEVINHLNSQGQQQQQQQQQGDQDGLTPQELESLFHSSDAHLASLGITRDEVNAAVEQYNASLGDEQAGDPAYDDGYGGQGQDGGDLAGAGAGGGDGGAETTAAFRALSKRVIQLQAKITASENRAKREGEELQFQAIDQKIELIAKQRDEAIALCSELVAENEALNVAVRTGTRPVKAGVDEGVRLFSAGATGELHEFQQRVKQLTDGGKLSPGKAIQLAAREMPGAHQDWLKSQTIRG